MTDLLFKLKKDGKTVGYVRIKEINGSLRIEQTVDIGVWWEPIGGGRIGSGQHFIECDSIHPFVTQDKNSKDVFAGDKVGISNAGKLEELGVVEFVRFQWCIKRTHPHTGKHYYDKLELFFPDIELIEE